MTQKLNSLKGLHEKLKTIKNYLDGILDDKSKVNREIIYNLQVNLLKKKYLIFAGNIQSFTKYKLRRND